FIDGTSWRQTDTATIADNFYQGHWNILLPQISWNGPGENYVGYEFQTITYLTALLYRIFGHHDWVARSLAVSFSLWGLFAFYQLVRQVWTEDRALLAATILAILPNAVYVGRSFLPDPVMLSCMMTAAWLLVVYLKTERFRYLLLATLAGTLGLSC
ncbi:MAG: glycosyltransferase family 39 protein, partial [Jaaginema sp. PMC 1079.18]|nr:glycosyltransferase family 39 protein [Jaaginema sp. PMC 1079.18]